MSESLLPPWPDNPEPTRATLHAYAHAVGAIPRAHALQHPKWWHISLTVTPAGLVTDTKSIPSGGSFNVRLDLRTHDVVVDTSDGEAARISMDDGLTGTEMGDRLVAVTADLGLEGDYARDKYVNDDPRQYSRDDATVLWQVLTNVSRILEQQRSTITGEYGPVQLWPHGFDLAFEWFGSRRVEHEEDGKLEMLPSQLNFGFYPGGEPYFYSNPWPFEADALLGTELPSGAVWHTEGWQGSMLPYDLVAGKPDAAERVLAFARTVYEAAAPTLSD